jgi:hypothetical protein
LAAVANAVTLIAHEHCRKSFRAGHLGRCLGLVPVRRGDTESGPSRDRGPGWRHDATIAAEIDFNVQAPIARPDDDSRGGWCQLPPDAAAYQGGTLARTDQYLYSKTISKFSNSGIYTPSGSWLEHCLVFRSGELAAQMTIRLPTSALESGEITATEIEKVFASARLTTSSIEDRGTSDPRLVLEIPDDFVPTGLPTYIFHLNHNRLPLNISVTLSDPATYETAKLLNRISARAWKVGSLARPDEYFYYFVWPDSFALGFRAAGATARINVGISRSSLDRGDIAVEEIERMLASARMIPAGEADKK